MLDFYHKCEENCNLWYAATFKKQIQYQLVISNPHFIVSVARYAIYFSKTSQQLCFFCSFPFPLGKKHLEKSLNLKKYTCNQTITTSNKYFHL